LNLLLFTEDERLDNRTVQLSGPRVQHLHRRGITAGQCLRVGEIGGLMGEGRLTALDGGVATLRVELMQPPPAKLPLVLVLALPRPKMLRRILRAVAELGVGELHLVNSYRVQKSYWQSPVLQATRWNEYLLQGLAQSRDTVLPVVSCHRRFKPWAEDRLPEMLAQRRGLLADPGDHPPCPRELTVETLLAVGPEGGFTAYEADLLRAAGCVPVSLGPRILRVENAVTALLGRLA